MKLPVNQIVCGDNLEVMASWPDNSVDTIITDPPYGIGFMGKDWDTFKSGYRNDNWAGYDEQSKTTPCMHAGKYDHSRNAEFQAWFTVWGKEALRILKPGGTMLIFGGTRTYHRLACGIEDAGFVLKDCIMWLYGSGFPKATDISKQLDKTAGKKFKSEPASGVGFMNAEGSGGYNVTKNKLTLIDESCPEAKMWNGYKSHGLKPAYEPILVAIKPNDGTYAQNALKWGVSGFNIDGGRIGFGSEADKKSAIFGRGTDIMGGHGTGKTNIPPDNKGRFPANVILDEQAAAMLDEQSGELKSGEIRPHHKTHESENNCMSGKNYARGPQFSPSSTGGASRFFYCAKASKTEQNRGCEDRDTTLFSEAIKGMDTKELKGMNASPRKGHGEIRNSNCYHNHHPTVKPLALMEYLCRLTKTPTGGIVLDPFCGSGTTAVACVSQGRDYIGIEKNAEYAAIARRRVSGQKEKMGLFEQRKVAVV